jgi:hypothetical protein
MKWRSAGEVAIVTTRAMDLFGLAQLDDEAVCCVCEVIKRVLAAVLIEPCRNSVPVGIAHAPIVVARRAQPAENPTQLNVMQEALTVSQPSAT